VNAADIQQIGRYQVKRFIAEGGMAWVFEVVDPTFEGYEVVRALKMLKPEAAAGDEFRRFQGEAALLAGIDHPNLVTIYEFGKDDATGCFFYTMTFIDGPTLSAYRDQHGGLTEDEVFPIFEEMLAGLAELHRRKIVHRDIKPANVLIGADGRARLADLGIARVQDNSGRTRTGFALGTVNYMSPEQARGRSVTPSSDVFSVGLTLYESLTGRLVYDDVEDLDSTSSHEVIGYLVHLARSGEEIEINFEAAGISPALAKVIAKACRFDPEERYADANEMLAALREARRSGRPEGYVPAEPRSRWPWIAAAFLLIAGAVTAYFVKQYLDGQRVETLLAQASMIEGELTAFVERGVNLEPPPAADLVEALRSSRAESQRYLADARADFEANRLQSAESNAERARDGLSEICGRIVSDYVGPLDTERMTAARARVEALGGQGVAEAFPDDFKKLAKMLPAQAATIGTGCSGGSAHLDRIELAKAIQLEATALETRLKDWWPTVAGEARDRALGAQLRAEGSPVDASPFVAAMQAATAALSQGDELRDADRWREARSAYQGAREQFEAAAAIAPASRAREDALKVERKLEEQGVPPKPETTRILTTAHESYREGHWKEATADFQTATARMMQDLDFGTAKVAAEAMRDTAASRRTEAVTAGAEGSAAHELAQGDTAMHEGAKALVAEKIDVAMAEFQKAERLFGTARDVSARAVEDAREGARAAERDIEACGTLVGPGAQAACGDARTALERGQRALAQLDAPTALQAFLDVTRSLQSAREASASYVDATQVPPSIVSYEPSQQTVEARRNQRLQFSIEARDENGDELSYEWSFEGNRLPESGPSLSFPPQREGKLQVAVIDSASTRDTRSWLIQLLNTPPNVAVTPKARSVDLSIGRSQTFKADVKDPDGDAVDQVWKLDGKQVDTGPRYTFQGKAEGSHKLEFVATDTGGERTVAMRRIEVTRAAPRPPEKINAPPVVSVTPGSAKLELTEGEHLTYEASVRDPDGDRVETKWKMGGKLVATGRSYDFAATTPGTYRLQFSASDGKETKTLTRTVVVRAKPQPKPSSPLAVSPVVSGHDCVAVPDDLAISSEWSKGVAVALQRYCTAIEKKNMADLQNIFSGMRTNPQQQFRWETSWRGKFASTRPIDLSLAIVSAYTSADDEVSLNLKQTEQLGERRARTRDYTVTLVKRGPNEWFIDAIN
jgi:hypothetical protein